MIKLKNKTMIWAGILFAQIILFFVLSSSSKAVIFFEFIFELKKNFFQSISSVVSVSIGDIIYILFIIYLLVIIYKILYRKSKAEFVNLLIFLNIIYFIYQCFWGMIYLQRPIINALDKQEPNTKEIKKLAIKYLNLAKDTRKLIKENEGNVFKIKNIYAIKKEIISQQNNLPEFLRKKNVLIENIKPSIYSDIMNYTGILGYYNPFTTEAQYNRNMPDTYIPFTISHEISHQLGFAREQEANFVAYLLGKDSKNIELKYTTEFFVLKSLLNSLIYEDEAFVKEIINQYSDGMKKDRQAEIDFVLEYQGLTNEFFSWTNDLFLKYNQQDGSITYSYFVDLLVRYERNNH